MIAQFFNRLWCLLAGHTPLRCKSFYFEDHEAFALVQYPSDGVYFRQSVCLRCQTVYMQRSYIREKI